MPVGPYAEEEAAVTSAPAIKRRKKRSTITMSALKATAAVNEAFETLSPAERAAMDDLVWRIRATNGWLDRMSKLNVAAGALHYRQARNYQRTSYHSMLKA